MYCRNCKAELNPKDNFCNNCGAKIIEKRITLKSLFSDVFLALGWDSNFLVTLRHLLSKPQKVCKEYITGTRNKYANPFAFFAISLAISLFVFSQFSEQLTQMTTNLSLVQTEITESEVSSDIKEDSGLEMLGYKNQEDFGKAIMLFQMKYYNLLSFLLLPLFTLIAFLVFRKPYNYGEHLVVNAYLQSITTFGGVILFVFSLVTGMNVFGTGSIILMLLYYSYAYKKLCNLTFGRLFVKILKFIGISLLIFLTLIIIAVIILIIKNKIFT